MEIVATFPIQLYISIYSTLMFDFSKAYAMFWTDCSSILFEVIDTHSLNSCTVFELMGMSAFLFFYFLFFLPVEQSLMCNCGQAWPMVTVNHSSLMIFGWNAHFCHLSSSPFFFLPVSQTIYLSFLIQPYDNENPPYVKVRHDHLYTYSFTILYVYRDMQRMTQ